MVDKPARGTRTREEVKRGRERAEGLVTDRTRFVLDEGSWTALNDALAQPAEVKPGVRELFARSRPE